MIPVFIIVAATFAFIAEIAMEFAVDFCRCPPLGSGHRPLRVLDRAPLCFNVGQLL